MQQYNKTQFSKELPASINRSISVAIVLDYKIGDLNICKEKILIKELSSKGYIVYLFSYDKKFTTQIDGLHKHCYSEKLDEENLVKTIKLFNFRYLFFNKKSSRHLKRILKSVIPENIYRIDIDKYLENKELFIPKKILFINLGTEKDLILSASLIPAIRKQYENSQIFYISKENYILKYCIGIEKKFILEPNDFGLLNINSKKLKDFLKENHFDITINLSPNLYSNYLLLFTRTTRIIKYKIKDKETKEIDYWLTTKRLLPDLKFKQSLDLSSIVNPNLRIQESKNKRAILIQTKGYSGNGNNFPLNKWIELINKILNKTRNSIFIIASKEEINKFSTEFEFNQINYIDENMHLAYKLSILEFCNIFIGTDSDFLNIAKKTNKKVIGIYGSKKPISLITDNKNFKIINADLKCLYCKKEKCKFKKITGSQLTPCMDKIDINKIIFALKDFMKES